MESSRTPNNIGWTPKPDPLASRIGRPPSPMGRCWRRLLASPPVAVRIFCPSPCRNAHQKSAVPLGYWGDKESGSTLGTFDSVSLQDRSFHTFPLITSNSRVYKHPTGLVLVQSGLNRLRPRSPSHIVHGALVPLSTSMQWQGH